MNMANDGSSRESEASATWSPSVVMNRELGLSCFTLVDVTSLCSCCGRSSCLITERRIEDSISGKQVRMDDVPAAGLEVAGGIKGGASVALGGVCTKAEFVNDGVARCAVFAG